MTIVKLRNNRFSCPFDPMDQLIPVARLNNNNHKNIPTPLQCHPQLCAFGESNNSGRVL